MRVVAISWIPPFLFALATAMIAPSCTKRGGSAASEIPPALQVSFGWGWPLRGGTFASLEAFRTKFFEGVGSRLSATDGAPAWDEPMLALASIRVCWECTDSDPVIRSAVLRPDDGRAFTTLELLFKIHNVVAPDFDEEDSDHCYLEGLCPLDRSQLLYPSAWYPAEDAIPTYEIRTGS